MVDMFVYLASLILFAFLAPSSLKFYIYIVFQRDIYSSVCQVADWVLIEEVIVRDHFKKLELMVGNWIKKKK